MGFGLPWWVSTAAVAGASVYDNYRSGYNLVQELKSKVGEKENRLGSKIRSRTITGQKRKADTMSAGVYSMTRRNVRRGKKMPYSKYMDKVVARNLVHVKERFGAISDPSDTVGNNRGAMFLNHGQWSDTTNITIDGVAYGGHIQYPIHVYSLCNTGQNPKAFATATNIGAGGYELVGGTAGGAIPGKLAWKRLGGWGKGTVVAPGVYNNSAGGTPWNIAEWELVDNETDATTVNLGRSALLEWFNAKILFYGKKTRPTYITVSLCQFPDEHFCPDYQWTESNASTTGWNEAKGITGEADEFWRARLRRLIANPCSSSLVTSHERKIKIIAKKIIKLAPKESIDSDADPHQQFINWFQRCNKSVDFSTPYDGAADTLNDTLTANPNYIQTSKNKIQCIPKTFMERNMYLLIESYSPDQNGTSAVPLVYNEALAGVTNPTNSTAASYDIMITKSWGKVD